jgi:hypothetical protein
MTFLVNTVPRVAIMEAVMGINIKEFDSVSVSRGISFENSEPSRFCLIKVKHKSLILDRTFKVDYHGKIRNNSIFLSNQEIVKTPWRDQWDIIAELDFLFGVHDSIVY